MSYKFKVRNGRVGFKTNYNHNLNKNTVYVCTLHKLHMLIHICLCAITHTCMCTCTHTHSSANIFRSISYMPCSKFLKTLNFHFPNDPVR